MARKWLADQHEKDVGSDFRQCVLTKIRNSVTASTPQRPGHSDPVFVFFGADISTGFVGSISASCD